MNRCVLLLGLVFVVVGCGSEGPSEGEQRVARQKCDTLKATLCSRILECGTTLTAKECFDALAAGLDCSRAVGVAASYPTCLQELPTYSCVVLDGGSRPPASCTGVILIP